jgi:signal transduction histidine kinase
VPAGLGLSAYRIVQEALTNVAKHARATSAAIDVEHTGTALVVTVTDDGTGPAARGPAGHGLLGMRERVALYGGTITAGPVDPPATGFRVRAELPGERQ